MTEKRKPKILWWLLVLLTALGLADWIITSYALQTGDFTELNPILGLHIGLFDEVKFASVLLLVMASLLVYWAEDKNKFKDQKALYNALVIVVALPVAWYIFVVTYNILLLKGMI